MSAKIWTVEEIKALLESNDRMLYRSLMMLYSQQTADEQRSKETREHNARGFSSYDAEVMSSFAEFLKRTGFLTPRQTVVCRRKIMKYAKQLTILANEEQEVAV